jgi:hypothetical protein
MPPATESDDGLRARRLRSVLLAVAGAVGVVVVVLAVLGAFDKNDADPRPQPVGTVPGAKEAITETANNWARQFASTAQACNDYTSRAVCEQTNCDGCRPSQKTRQWAAVHRGATVQRIVIRGDRATATFNGPSATLRLETLQLRRTAAGEWLVVKLGPLGAGPRATD